MKCSLKKRVDAALVERKLIDSREKAQRLIMAGKVRLNQTPVTKPSQMVLPEDLLTLDEVEKFVSRGGYKLEAALDFFEVSPENKVCLDIGASTGGFSDCLLQRGARKVYAVDVGKNQLDWKIRSNPRVKVMDETNARYLIPSQLEEPAEVVTLDASFISLTKLLPTVRNCTARHAILIALIKPQFEAGKEKVEKGGVIRKPEVHQEVIKRIHLFVQEELHDTWIGVIESPLKGPAGNKEFLACFEKNDR